LLKYSFEKISFKKSLSKRFIYSTLVLLSFSILTFAQENIYHPTDIVAFDKYLKSTTVHEIKELSKPHLSKKKKVYKKRLKLLKKQVKDSSFVFVPELSLKLEGVLDIIYKFNPYLKQYNFYFLISKSVVPNAGSYGDGNFVVNLGLFNYLDSDDELAFILCHEIAHFLNDDFNSQLNEYINTLNSSITKSRIREIKRRRYGRTTAGIELIKELSFDFFDYSREKEINADLLGYKLYKNTPFNHNAALTSLQKLGQLEDVVFNDSISLVSSFNFKEFPFNPKWIEKKSNIFNTKDVIDDYEFEKDSLRTHPHAKERVNTLSLQNSIDTINFKRSYTDIIALKKSSKKIINQVLFDFHNYDQIVYYALRNIMNNNASIEDYTNISLSLQLVHKNKKSHKLGMYIPRESPFSEEKYLNKIRHFFHNTELRDIKKIARLYLQENKKNIEVETYNIIYKYFNP